MCVLNSIKPLSLKPGGGWLSFFPAVSRGSCWGPQSDTVHIALFVQVGSILCLSRIIKNIQVCLFAGLVSDKMNEYRSSFICVLQWKGSGGIKKELSVTWISVSLLFSGLCAFSWCGKNQTGRHRSLACIVSIVSVQKMIGGGAHMQSFKYHPYHPLSIYPSKTTHKAIQMYKLTKEDLDSEEDKNSALWLQN